MILHEDEGGHGQGGRAEYERQAWSSGKTRGRENP
jgi:hypothetical protein